MLCSTWDVLGFYLRLLEFFLAVQGLTDDTPDARFHRKRDSWVLKKFCVLVKRKLARGQVPRNENFRALLAILAEDENQDWDGQKTQTYDLMTYICILVACR